MLFRSKKRIILALEMLTPQHNAAVKKFLQGKISENSFLEAIGFEENWGFPWENYKALFDFAREHQIEIRGINHHGTFQNSSLKKRDQFAAKIISDLSLKEPNSCVFVFQTF